MDKRKALEYERANISICTIEKDGNNARGS